MQPTFKHVPPNVFLNSTQAVLKPNYANLIAETSPPGPPPIPIASKLVFIIKDLEIIYEVPQNIL